MLYHFGISQCYGMPVQTTHTPRTTKKATSISRCEHNASKLEDLEASFQADDDLSSLSLPDISAKLSEETSVPQGFTVTLLNDALLIYMLELEDNIPSVVDCITLKSDHTVVCSLQGKVVPASQYDDLAKGRLTQLVLSLST